MNPELSILIINGTKPHHIDISKALEKAGYLDIRNIETTAKALSQLNERPAGLVIVESMLPTVNGLDLANQIKQQDEANDRFTYILMVSPHSDIEDGNNEGGDKEVYEATSEHSIDDFIDNTHLDQELFLRVATACRTSDQINQLIQDNHRLLEANRDLSDRAFIDPTTGLGNQKYAEHLFADYLSHVQNRGGIMCSVLFRLDTRDAKLNITVDTVNEIVQRFSHRLKQQTRAMDQLCVIDTRKLLLLSTRSCLDQCERSQFKRILKKLTQTAYQTSAGFFNIDIDISVILFDPNKLRGEPTCQELMLAFQRCYEQEPSEALRINQWPVPF